MSALLNDPKADGSNPAEPRKDGELDDHQLDQASGGSGLCGAQIKVPPGPQPPPTPGG